MPVNSIQVNFVIGSETQEKCAPLSVMSFPTSHFLISSQKEDEERKRKEEEEQRNAAGHGSNVRGGGGKAQVSSLGFP